MLIFNISQALNMVNDKKALFDVRSPIEILSTLCSGLLKSLSLTVNIGGLTQFTLS